MRAVTIGLGIVAVGILLGCSSDGTLGEGEYEPVLAEGWQLVNRAYPFTGEHGEDVCGEWQQIDSATGETTVDREWYWFGKMNEMLAERVSVDDREAVAAARNGGITRVGTCDEARQFTRLRREYAESQPVVEPEQTSPNGPDTEDFSSDRPAARVDKIAVSTVYLDPATVRIVRPLGNGVSKCSGVLIGARALLTAAHCLPSLDPFQNYKVAVDYGTAQPYPCFNVGCTGSADNSAAWPFSGYTGSGDIAHDVALVISDANWGSPANTNASWSRILNQMTSLSDYYFMQGYGWTATTGGTSDEGRYGNYYGWIGAQAPDFWHFIVQSNVSRPCHGDSGGPANNQS